MIYAAASAFEGDDVESVDLDWERGGNLNRCRKPADVDAAFDRGEERVGVALIALVPDTGAVLPRVARGLRSPNPGARRQSLLALMHTARLHGRVDAITVELLHGLLSDRTPISAGSPYEVRGTAAQDRRGPSGVPSVRALARLGEPLQRLLTFRTPTASRPEQGRPPDGVINQAPGAYVAVPLADRHDPEKSGCSASRSRATMLT